MIIVIGLEFFIFIVSLYLVFDMFLENDYWRIAKYFSYETMLYGSCVISFLSFLLATNGILMMRGYTQQRYVVSVALVFIIIVQIYVGSGAYTTSRDIELHIDTFCRGGFPKLTSFTQPLLTQILNAEDHFIGKYMCNKRYCACTNKIDKRLFPGREKEFDQLDTTGNVTLFYRDCYQKITKENLTTSYKLTPEFLNFYQQLEVNNDCSGLCQEPLFYFFKENTGGPPSKTCKDEIVSYIKKYVGSLGVFLIAHAINLILYFITQFTFWAKYSEK